jgi:hypothetical protein
MDTKEILKKIKNNTISTNELKKFGKDKQVIIAVKSVGEDAIDLIDESLRKDDDILNALSQHDY